jgi:hypothetical protein
MIQGSVAAAKAARLMLLLPPSPLSTSGVKSSRFVGSSSDWGSGRLLVLIKIGFAALRKSPPCACFS